VDRQARLERIYETVREIPSGNVASYGQVAEIAGIPRGARQVGWALKQLSRGQDVPWHRVISASGRIAFEAGSVRFEKQKALLAEEDVAVIAGRVDLRKYRWRPKLDELLWKPTSAWDDH
jgi:methylated-DNA-protein-cysteine methyltransferase related protein